MGKSMQMALALIAAASALAGVRSVASQPVADEKQPNQSRPGYILVVGKTTDRAKIAAYAAALPSIYASLNGYYLAIGGSGRGVNWLEGPWQDRSIIFAKFPNRSDVEAFWWGEAYRQAIKKRDNAGVFSVVALEGSAPLAFEGAGTGFLIVMTAPRDGSIESLSTSARATRLLIDSVTAAGGVLLTSPEVGQFKALEGDSLFDRIIIAAWPTVAARDAYLASPKAKEASALRRDVGLSLVAAANGVPRSQAPTAVVTSPVKP